MKYFVIGEDSKIDLSLFQHKPTEYMESPVQYIGGKTRIAVTRYFETLESFVPPDGDWYLYSIWSTRSVNGFMIRYTE